MRTFRFSLMLLLGSLFLTACGQQDSKPNTAGTEGTKVSSTSIENLEPGAFQKKIADTPGIQVVDVRTPGEHSGGHIPHSQNIDINGSGFDAAIDQLDKTKPVALYCAVGGRSSRAAQQIQSKGFPAIYNLSGGFNAWSGQGLPTE